MRGRLPEVVWVRVQVLLEKALEEVETLKNATACVELERETEREVTQARIVEFENTEKVIEKLEIDLLHSEGMDSERVSGQCACVR